eukprot:g3583.t1
MQGNPLALKKKKKKKNKKDVNGKGKFENQSGTALEGVNPFLKKDRKHARQKSKNFEKSIEKKKAVMSRKEKSMQAREKAKQVDIMSKATFAMKKSMGKQSKLKKNLRKHVRNKTIPTSRTEETSKKLAEIATSVEEENDNTSGRNRSISSNALTHKLKPPPKKKLAPPPPPSSLLVAKKERKTAVDNGDISSSGGGEKKREDRNNFALRKRSVTFGSRQSALVFIAKRSQRIAELPAPPQQNSSKTPKEKVASSFLDNVDNYLKR